MSRMWGTVWRVTGVALLLAMPLAVRAAIVIEGTRVVYPEGSREVNVRLKNVEKDPVLVQAWIDDGRASAAPSEIEVPFMLMPAVFRIEPNKGQTMRLVYTGDTLPADRESVFWLNVLEIPPKPQGDDDRSTLQLAFRTRIKLFYRPSALQEDPSAVHAQLKWRLVRGASGEQVLRAENPSPYYLSLAEIGVDAPIPDVSFDPQMVPPFGEIDFKPKKGKMDSSAPVGIHYSILNDYGSEVKGTATAGQ